MDIKIDDETGRITTMGELPVLEEEKGKTWIDAEGLHVFPGGIDVHVHFRDPGNPQKEDFYTGSRAALYGGITTILDMPNTEPKTITLEALEEKRKIAKEKAVCDYGLYFGATNDNYLGAAKSGAIALKIFMAASTGDFYVKDFTSLVKHFKNFPGMISVHAEDPKTIEAFGRSIKAEIAAVQKVLRLAANLDRPVHICHVTSLKTIKVIEEAKRKGVKATFEMTPHHLLLNEKDLAKHDYLNCLPPLRDEQEQKILLAHMEKADVFASDHAPHTKEEKKGEKKPAGIPGVDVMFRLLLDLTSKNRLFPVDLAKRIAYNPARIFNIQRKGFIKSGYDGDLVLVNLEEEYRFDKTYSKCGWSPYLGRTLWGKIMKVYLRGKEVFNGEEVTAEKGFGKEIEHKH